MQTHTFFPSLKQKFLNHPANEIRVLVGGCFDVLHFGHVSFLNAAKAHGNFLIVALESDEFIHTSKKRAPIHNQKERQMILENLRSVDMVISLPFLQSYDEYLELVKIIRPQIIAVTENDSQLFNKERQAEMVGGRVIAVTPQIKTFSTTKILTGHR